MKVATIAMGIGLSAFLMTGCGGGPTDPTNPDDTKDAAKATGKLDENNTTRLLRIFIKNKLLPARISAEDAGIRSHGHDLKYVAGGYGCKYGGTYTVTKTSGEDPSSQKVKNSKYVFERKYEDCSFDPGVKINGTEKNTWDWKSVNGTYTNNQTMSATNFVYTVDDKHTFTLTDVKEEAKTINVWDNGVEVQHNYKRKYSYSGTHINGTNTTQYKNIVVETEWGWNHQEDTDFDSLKLAGSLENHILGGTIIFSTPTMFERNQMDKVPNPLGGKEEVYHAGTMKMEGKDHTYTLSVSADHKVEAKYDDKVKGSYENMVDFNWNTGYGLIGAWAHACYQPKGKTFHMDRNITFESDGNFKLIKTRYNDQDCTDVNATKNLKGTFKIGAYEKNEQDRDLDVQINGNIIPLMFRIKDKDTLIFSDFNTTDAHGRANHFDPYYALQRQ